MPPGPVRVVLPRYFFSSVSVVSVEVVRFFVVFDFDFSSVDVELPVVSLWPLDVPLIPLLPLVLEPDMPLEPWEPDGLPMLPVPVLVPEEESLPLGAVELDPLVDPVLEPRVDPAVEPVELSVMTSSRCTLIASPDPEKLARTWSPSFTSLIDARLPSFVTCVLESTFSVFPDSVSVLLDRSKLSTRPVSSLSCPMLDDDAVAPLVSRPVVVLAVPEGPEEPVLPGVLALLDDGSVDDAEPPVLPIEPLRVSLVLLPVELPGVAGVALDPLVLSPAVEPVDPLLDPLLLCARVRSPAKVNRPATSATPALHPTFLITFSPFSSRDRRCTAARA